MEVEKCHEAMDQAPEVRGAGVEEEHEEKDNRKAAAAVSAVAEELLPVPGDSVSARNARHGHLTARGSPATRPSVPTAAHL